MNVVFTAAALEQVRQPVSGGIPLRRTADDPDPPVTGIPVHREVTRLRELGDELADALLRHTDPLGQVGDGDAFARDVSDDPVVGRAEAGLALSEDE